MISIDAIRSEIPDFAGYESEDDRRKSDSQIRACIGERLVTLGDLDSLTPEQRELYDRVLLECEFMRQDAFHSFELDPPESRIASVLAADSALIELAKQLGQAGGDFAALLTQIDQALAKRCDAMQNA